jgi:hypothetical protein
MHVFVLQGDQYFIFDDRGALGDVDEVDSIETHGHGHLG